MFVKKGQLEIQFNWVFVLVAGGIVLAFFLVIINSQQEKATAEVATDVVQRLDTVFTTLSKQPNSVEKFSLSNILIEFVCEDDLSEYYIFGTGPVSTKFDTIFTQSELKGREVVSWTQQWEVPFEAGVFMLLSNDRTLYVFVNESSDLIYGLYTEMPSAFRKLNIRTSDIASLDLSGYNRYVFVTTINDLNQAYADLPDLMKSRTAFRIIEPSAVSPIYGQIGFLRADALVTSVSYAPYFLDPSLWGSIFTEDKSTYMCTMDKAMSKMKITAAILEERSLALKDALSTGSCFDVFSDVHQYYVSLKNTVEFDDAGVELFYDISFSEDGLERFASDSLRGYDCPYVY